MHRLFNSRGQYIARWVGDQLYAPSGKHIGRYVPSKTIFIDLGGHYLGEIVRGNRLMFKLSSSFRQVHFGRQKECGQIDSFDHPEHLGRVEVPRAYTDVSKERLRCTGEQEKAGKAEADAGRARNGQLTGSSSR